jgi:hypothetical protein
MQSQESTCTYYIQYIEKKNLHISVMELQILNKYFLPFVYFKDFDFYQYMYIYVLYILIKIKTKNILTLILIFYSHIPVLYIYNFSRSQYYCISFFGAIFLFFLSVHICPHGLRIYVML